MSIDPNDPRMRAIYDAYNRGDFKKEASLVVKLLKKHPKDAELLQRAGSTLAQLGQVEKAERYLKRALEVSPDNAQIWYMLGWVYRKMTNLPEAARCVEKVIALNPNLPEPYVDLGNFRLTQGNASAARACFEKAIKLNPGEVNAIVNLASLCEREHKFDEAQALAERAVSLAPTHAPAMITLAQVKLRQGKSVEAVAIVQKLMKTTVMNDQDSASAYNLIGQAKDRDGEYDAAFSAFEAANDKMHAHFSEAISTMDSALAPKSLQRLNMFFTEENVSGWTKLQDAEHPAPVFLLGFPRSGTTLLDQILNTHSAIKTLEEKENLIDIRNDIVKPVGGLKKLRAMNDKTINQYREKYWGRVRESFAGDINNGLIIDKMPLNMLMLGVIYRVFPEAKIIFAQRDPRDVVLSCYQQHFGMNAAMYQLLKFDTAAMYYDQVMSIGENMPHAPAA
ncbi:tetratricopeptide repeat protein [Hyphococcus flavus]|uniref:Tetratricopeptide repeat protein n=1 Tax=Hyphococcus flavus TaxID=1866326 RepID=A0AAE9ZA67_9PROT|nr:tetratricopeptide repeat-containing sulfotransferase family protein [Hyphococcus flavus]WDI30334.1 tetratricopeptide repeat protein [Hyphococcus flavus]